MKKGLIKSIVASVFAVLSFVALAVPFFVGISSFKGHSTSASGSLSDWTKFLDSGAEKLGLWKLSEVLMIILLICLVVAIALAFVSVWVDNKIVAVLQKVFAIVTLVLSIVFIICFVAGGLVYGAQYSGGDYSLVYLPHAGPVMLAVTALVAACLCLPRKAKEKKA